MERQTISRYCRPLKPLSHNGANETTEHPPKGPDVADGSREGIEDTAQAHFATFFGGEARGC